MIKFDLRLFVFQLNQLERCEKELRGHLRPEELPTEPQMKAMGLPLWISDAPAALATDAGRKWIWSHIGPMLDQLPTIGLAASELEIQHIWNHSHKWTRAQLADGYAALRWKIQEELREKFFLFLDKEESLLFQQSKPFGHQLAEAFPSANGELVDAAQCIAVNKGTAAVFHSMRAVESGIGALASEVGKTFDVQQWNVILNEIECEITKYRKNGIPGLDKAQKDAKLEFLSRAAIQIGYFKDGWRNYVSHNKRPYDEGEAKSIYEHVGIFMSVLSERLSE